jgi:3-methylcrotonyl-CoA carboxylase beta subunit/propionyl-CoA carboxylase
MGKLPVRERIDKLLDPRSPLLELSPLAAWDLYDNDAPSAGIVTGIGRVAGREVLIVANDASRQGGTYYPITVKSTCGRRRWRLQNRLPCRLSRRSRAARSCRCRPRSSPIAITFGRIFFNQARMSAERIPQVAVVMGSCTAVARTCPAMSDETIIVRGTGTNLSRRASPRKGGTGEEVTARSSAARTSTRACRAVADYLAEDDEHACRSRGRSSSTLNTVKHLPATSPRPKIPPTTRRRSTASSSADTRKPYEVREIIAGWSTARASTSSRSATRRRW